MGCPAQCEQSLWKTLNVAQEKGCGHITVLLYLISKETPDITEHSAAHDRPVQETGALLQNAPILPVLFLPP